MRTVLSKAYWVVGTAGRALALSGITLAGFTYVAWTSTVYESDPGDALGGALLTWFALLVVSCGWALSEALHRRPSSRAVFGRWISAGLATALAAGLGAQIGRPLTITDFLYNLANGGLLTGFIGCGPAIGLSVLVRYFHDLYLDGNRRIRATRSW